MRLYLKPLPGPPQLGGCQNSKNSMYKLFHDNCYLFTGYCQLITDHCFNICVNPPILPSHRKQQTNQQRYEHRKAAIIRKNLCSLWTRSVDNAPHSTPAAFWNYELFPVKSKTM